jgi:adenylosuccinate lyase
MDEFSIKAISPIDGRYQNKCVKLSNYFSEYGLIRYRLRIEIDYFIELCSILPELKDIDLNIRDLTDIYTHFDPLEIKKIEKETNHDVKAVEYYIRNRFKLIGIKQTNFIHFGLTSQDINNTALPLALFESMSQIVLPQLNSILDYLIILSNKWIEIPLLSKTHGQPASPTILGKEIMVFIERLKIQIEMLSDITLYAKFGGAVGNFNAHTIAYPTIDWVGFSDRFIEKYGLKRSRYTTQIDHYDSLGVLFDNIKRVNTILLDLCRDMWMYISDEVFKLKIVEGEVGSSTMPHKVNPINFENSEANLMMSNTLLEFFSRKLPVSRLQRDLTDSSVCRNIGVALGHSLVSYSSLLTGLEKIEVNTTNINSDLENNWVVVAEGIVSILKKNNYPDPYEVLKHFTRKNKAITKENIKDFISSLNINEKIREQLRNITPYNYTGLI